MLCDGQQPAFRFGEELRSVSPRVLSASQISILLSELAGAVDAAGIAVISGHRDTHLNFMKRLDEGDLIKLERYDGDVSSYVVTRLAVANSHSIHIDTSGAGHKALVLITCWPVDSPLPGGDERWVVEAHRLTR